MWTADRVCILLFLIVPTPSQSFNYGCGGTISQTSGIITSPGFPRDYPNSIICQWKIAAQTPDVIELRFHHFLLESSGTCDFDSVSIYDGFDSNKRLIGKYCGAVVLDVVMSKNLLIEMRTDRSATYKGFNATFVSKACGETLTQREGIITSPGYPKGYPTGVSCQWNVTAQKNEVIELRFSDFSLQSCPLCTCDSVTVYADNGSDIVPIGLYCGGNGPSNLISETELMQIVLLTDGRSSYKGFNASFVRACSTGWYGPACNFSCSQNCLQSSNRSVCNETTGHCLKGCSPGFLGDSCQYTCDKDKYGPECVSQCSQHCSRTTPTTSSCHHVDGRCFLGCQDGYQGLTCQTICDQDRYGPGCLEPCSNNCQRNTVTNSSCHHVTGHCFTGCFDGFHGEKCDEVWSQTNKITALAVLCALLVAALIISHVLVYIRRRNTEKTNQDTYMNVVNTNSADKPQPNKETHSSTTQSSVMKGTCVPKRSPQEKPTTSDKFYDIPDNPESTAENEYITIGDVK